MYWDVDGEPVDLAPDTMYNEIKNNKGIYHFKVKNTTILLTKF